MVFVITLQIYTAVILGRCWIIAEKLDPSIVVKNRFVDFFLLFLRLFSLNFNGLLKFNYRLKRKLKLKLLENFYSLKLCV